MYKPTNGHVAAESHRKIKSLWQAKVLSHLCDGWRWMEWRAGEVGRPSESRSKMTDAQMRSSAARQVVFTSHGQKDGVLGYRLREPQLCCSH